MNKKYRTLLTRNFNLLFLILSVIAYSKLYSGSSVSPTINLVNDGEPLQTLTAPEFKTPETRQVFPELEIPTEILQEIEAFKKRRNQKRDGWPAKDLVNESFEYINEHIETISEKTINKVIAGIEHLAIGNEFNDILQQLQDKFAEYMQYHKRKIRHRIDKDDLLPCATLGALALASGIATYYLLSAASKREADCIKALKKNLNDMNVRVEYENWGRYVNAWITWPPIISKEQKKIAEEIIEKIWRMSNETKKPSFLEGASITSSTFFGCFFCQSLLMTIRHIVGELYMSYYDPEFHKKGFERYAWVIQQLEQAKSY